MTTQHAVLSVAEPCAYRDGKRKSQGSLNSALLLISDSTKHLYQRNGLHARCTVLRVEVCGTFRSPPSFLRLTKDTINVTSCQLLYVNRWFEVDDAHSRWQEGGRMLKAFLLTHEIWIS